MGKKLSFSQSDARYAEQAQWTKDLRLFLYRKIPDNKPVSVLEVGCGTGAVLREIRAENQNRQIGVTGLDIDPGALHYAKRHGSQRLVAGNGEELPFGDEMFDLVICHYLLLWVKDPIKIIREMWRVTKPAGICAALAEPCYSEMTAKPHDLYKLAVLQRDELQQSGADISVGKKLPEIFRRAEVKNVFSDQYKSAGNGSDFIRKEIQQMLIDTGKADFPVDLNAEFLYNIPTYFAFAEKGVKDEL